MAAAASTATAAGARAERPVPWPSPISSEAVVSKVLRLGSPSVLPSGDVFWLEGRAWEAGRSVLVHRSPAGKVADLTPGPAENFNVRTTVHEYGGGEHLVAGDGRAYWANFKDQRVYWQDVEQRGPPQPLTAEGSKQRFADFVHDAARGRLIAVCEDHAAGEGKEPANSIAAIDLASGAVTQLAQGYDFYAGPALSPDGRQLAFVAWRHPYMPWDDTELLLCDLDEAGAVVGQPHVVAGGKDVSVQQPRWGPDGSLFFVGDASGWWNLYRLEGGGEARPLLPMAAEFGVPPWTLGLQSYVIVGGGAAVLAVFNDPAAAGSSLGVIDVASSTLARLDTGLTSFGRLAAAGPGLADPEGELLLVTAAGSAARPQAVLRLRAAGLAALVASSPADWEVLQPSSELDLDPGFISQPQTLEYPTTGGATAFMVFYPPTSRDFQLPPGQLPPLLVKAHGGPTSAASTLFSLSYQWWTSRGFAIADVNYGGSTGYGRAYRNRLRGSWGVVDVDDCCAAAEHLVARGLADPARLCIDGGSAGGYTTLACMAFRDVFKAGASLYGVADTELLALHTHKFESRYLDLLLGPYPASKDLYRQRSPINSVGRITAPVAIFQGDQDEIVPEEQAKVMYEALKAKGLPTTLMIYKGEQHGFRKAESIRSALEGELFFYGKVLGFNATYSPDLQPITIDNLAGGAAAAGGAAGAGAKDEL